MEIVRSTSSDRTPPSVTQVDFVITGRSVHLTVETDSTDIERIVVHEIGNELEIVHDRSVAPPDAGTYDVEFNLDALTDPASVRFTVDVIDGAGNSTSRTGKGGLYLPDVSMLRASVATDGTTQGDGMSWPRAVSTGGRYTFFASDATNLVSGDTNGTTDLFVHDRATGETTRIDIAGVGGAAPNGGLSDYKVSADGRYVVFISDASNLVLGDDNVCTDVFLHDRLTGETTRVSDAPGVTENQGSHWASVSADGRYVA